MTSKKNEARFTIQFSETDPKHLRAIGILNRQGRRSKAPYLVEAILHYESCAKTPDTSSSNLVEIIQDVVMQMLNQQQIEFAGHNDTSLPVSTPVCAKKIDFDDAVNTLGEDGIAAIANSMSQFRTAK